MIIRASGFRHFEIQCSGAKVPNRTLSPNSCGKFRSRQVSLRDLRPPGPRKAMVGMCSRIMRDRGEGVEKSSRKLLNSLYGLGGSASGYIDFFCRLGGCGSEQVTNSRFRIFPRFDMRGSINGARRSCIRRILLTSLLNAPYFFLSVPNQLNSSQKVYP